MTHLKIVAVKEQDCNFVQDEAREAMDLRRYRNAKARNASDTSLRSSVPSVEFIDVSGHGPVLDR